MKRLTPSDAMFLYGETRETMMHASALLPFSAPEEAIDFRAIMDEIRAGLPVVPPWSSVLKTPDVLRNPMQAWVEDPKVDLEYHVRRTALPTPGDERELGVLVSRLHAHPVDFHRPPWEAHYIEGLEGGRFALFVKVHHSLIDGYTAMKLLGRSLSRDAKKKDVPHFFAMPPEERRRQPEPREGEGEGAGLGELLSAVRAQAGTARGVGKAILNLAKAARAKDDALMTPLSAPKSILNAPISRSRRFATQRLETARLKAVARAAGGTLNDVVLSLCGASLRRYLLERNALPEQPLVAMCPVNVRAKDDEGGGNAVGAILASLGTDVADPSDRLTAVMASTRRGKEQLQGLSKAGLIQYGALLLAPFMIQMLPGAVGRVAPAFNVVISNVPGPEEPLYFRGARLEALYPMSILVHGLALNITCAGYAGTLGFGFVGCRDTLPHLQRMAVFCGEALEELERTVLGSQVGKSDLAGSLRGPRSQRP